MNYIPHHTAISVRNLEKTLKFYETLGFKQVHRYDDQDRIGVKLKLNGYVLEIFAFKNNAELAKLELNPGNNIDKIGVKHFGLSTDDIGQALLDLKSKGLANEKTTILSKGTARFFFIQDPDGMWVEIIKDDRYS